MGNEANQNPGCCPRCGAAIGDDAPEGLCPRCLIALNLATQTEIAGDDGGTAGATTAKAPLQPPVPPDQLARHFPQLEILECLGRGGMGVVYKARHLRLDRLVALKILAPEKEGEERFADRFEREARALARLSHANIVAVYDFGRVEGKFYLMMEFVDGASLRQLLQSRRIAPEEALAIVPKICEALQYAHEQGVVHRDIKPENVLLDKQGRVKIADFGIAKILGQPVQAGLTQEQQVIGTPHYMAPEQIEKPTEVDHRADIYSLGVVFYEMLTGELPLGKFAPPSNKVRIDVRLDEVVLHALEKEPARRYQHAGEVKTDVETILGSAPTSPPAARSALVRSYEALFRMTFTSPAALKALNLSALGFLGFLSVLAAIPALPPTVARRCLGMSGFFGFFGLIGVACFLEMRARRKKAKLFTAEGGQISSAAERWVIAMRWTARVLGTVLLLFCGIFVVAEGLPPTASQPEGVQLNFIALALMLLGFVVGWKREGAAALLIASGWTVWQISENLMEWNFFQTPLPVAALYAACWWATHGRKTARAITATAIFAVVLFVGRLVCPANVFVGGVVSNAASGDPITNAELRLMPRPAHPATGSDAPDARSNQTGRFRLYVSWYAPGKEVAINAPGFTTLKTNLGSRPLGARGLRLDVKLQPERGTNHSVIEFNDPPLRGATQGKFISVKNAGTAR